MERRDSVLRVGVRAGKQMMAVAITRTDLDVTGLRQAASRSEDASATRRMLAFALMLDGHSRAEAAGLCGMDRQTLRDRGVARQVGDLPHFRD